MMESNTKLEAARRLRGWSLEVASQKIGVHPRTLRRWETGKSKPHGFRVYKISEVYEMTPSALGIGSERHQWYTPDQRKAGHKENLLLTRVVEPLITDEELDLHLMGLILQRKLERNNLDYRTFQLQIHQCIQAYDQSLQALQVSYSTDPLRIQALRVVASIPVAMYLEDITRRSQLAESSTDILTYCASAITACWHMDLQSNLSLARTLVSGYIILLSEVFARSEPCRPAAAELIAQACVLRTMLAIQLEGPHTSVSYYTRALEFSQFADGSSEETSFAIHTHTLHGYGRQPARTLQKMAESLWLLRPVPPSPDFCLVRDYLQKMTSFYQMPDLAMPEMEQGIQSEPPQAFHFPGTIDYARTALNLWDGLTYHELDTYAQVLNSSRTDNPYEEPVCDGPEEVREEFLHNRALASLRLHDMEQGITTLRAAIPQALSLGNEQELVEVRKAYHMTQFLIPGESSRPAQEVKDLLKKHD
ncbi:MAG TPA: helix-turn-helix transcriptional regulator [Ktedonobacteraceae bacterium]